LSGDAITTAGRILAAADFYHAKIELRPHREALTPEATAAALADEVAAGRIDSAAGSAVLKAAGQAVRPNPLRKPTPAVLTAREIEVLRLLVRGLSNREIAERLVISKKTASNHIEHIYAKSGATNRAQASLFALKHGLMADL
jgi:DNA-binding NarL/FixJ family response regulator